LVGGIACFVVGGVFLDQGVGGGGFSKGAEKAGEGFDFDATERGAMSAARSLLLNTPVKWVGSSLLVMRVLMIGSSQLVGAPRRHTVPIWEFRLECHPAVRRESAR
jgi:hypothetical protein